MERLAILAFLVAAVLGFGGLLWPAHFKGLVLPPWPPFVRQDDWGWFMFQVVALWACLIASIVMLIILWVTWPH